MLLRISGVFKVNAAPGRDMVNWFEAVSFYDAFSISTGLSFVEIFVFARVLRHSPAFRRSRGVRGEISLLLDGINLILIYNCTATSLSFCLRQLLLRTLRATMYVALFLFLFLTSTIPLQFLLLLLLGEFGFGVLYFEQILFEIEKLIKQLLVVFNCSVRIFVFLLDLMQ